MLNRHFKISLVGAFVLMGVGSLQPTSAADLEMPTVSNPESMTDKGPQSVSTQERIAPASDRTTSIGNAAAATSSKSSGSVAPSATIIKGAEASPPRNARAVRAPNIAQTVPANKRTTACSASLACPGYIVLGTGY
jgi:hypothetical protein